MSKATEKAAAEKAAKKAAKEAAAGTILGYPADTFTLRSSDGKTREWDLNGILHHTENIATGKREIVKTGRE